MFRKYLVEEKAKSLVLTEKSKNECATNSLDNSPYISEASISGKNDSDLDSETSDDTAENYATETNDSDTDDDQDNSEDNWATVVEKLVALLQTKVHELKDQEWKETDGIYNENIKPFLGFLLQLCFELPSRNAPLLFVKQARKETARIILEAEFIPKICMILTDIYMKKLETCNDKTKKTLLSSYATSVLWNYTDASIEFAECVAHIPGFLEFVREMLTCTKYEQMNNTEENVSTTDELVEGLLAIVHNISMTDSCLPRLRALRFTEVLIVYLKSPNIEVQLNALASLAAIIDEAESEIIKSNESSVRILVERFRRGLQSEERRGSGWSCQECALTIKMLARNDANKKLLVELGALEPLVELAGGDIEEQKEAVGALWALSFDEDIREKMVRNDKLGLIPCLEKLKSSEDKGIKKAVSGILWNLRSLLQNAKGKQFQNIVKSLLASRKKKDNQTLDNQTKKEGHIMISYQWSHQKILMKIKDELVKNGFMVWMDVEQMMGSTVQAMAEAVENADIVLICLSHKYKNSENCRQEAEYSFQLKKKIVPLKLEEGYKPDGWLGFIAGAKLYYEFSGHRPYDEELQRLVQALKKMKQQLASQPADVAKPPIHEDFADGPISHGSVISANRQLSNTVKQWSQDDVNNWMKKNGLSWDKFGNLSADAIALLVRMKSEAPEAFYRYIEKLWTCDLDLLSKLVWALDSIET